MTKWWMISLVSALLGVISVPCGAEKAYVLNPTKITLRNGPGIKEKILAMLPQDEPVEIMEKQDEWTRVRLLDPKWSDKEGWVVSGFLVSRIPWEIQAASLKNENAQLKEKLSRVETEWREVSTESNQLKGRLEGNARTLSELQKKYQSLKEESGGFLKLKKEYEVVRQRMQDALATSEELTKENLALKSSQRNTWFLTGGATW